ncbi:MAG: hypothetical protein SF162_16440 [bacterium]|nr:hypothetical protein [bacterium]
MRLRFTRANTIWLSILAGMIGIGALGGADNPAVIAALVGIFGLSAAAALIDVQPERIIDQSRSSLTAIRMSAEAREASERARRRGNIPDTGLMLFDIGLFTASNGQDGLTMQRTREVSKDEDGVRPFIQLHVQPRSADRAARIKFELIDQRGDVQYVHEMNTHLRDGEMNILPDHHLPLLQNQRVTPGDWDLRVYIDGSLIGAHSFSVIPSFQDRFPRTANRSASGAAPAPRTHNPLSDEDADSRTIRTDDAPMTLEDLLRSRGQNDGSGGGRS